MPSKARSQRAQTSETFQEVVLKRLEGIESAMHFLVESMSFQLADINYKIEKLTQPGKPEDVVNSSFDWNIGAASFEPYCAHVELPPPGLDEEPSTWDHTLDEEPSTWDHTCRTCRKPLDDPIACDAQPCLTDQKYGRNCFHHQECLVAKGDDWFACTACDDCGWSPLHTDVSSSEEEAMAKHIIQNRRAVKKHKKHLRAEKAHQKDKSEKSEATSHAVRSGGLAPQRHDPRGQGATDNIIVHGSDEEGSGAEDIEDRKLPGFKDCIVHGSVEEGKDAEDIEDAKLLGFKDCIGKKVKFEQMVPHKDREDQIKEDELLL